LLISPYAPHIAEELWFQLGNTDSVSEASFPVFNPEYLIENSITYPVSFNGKMRYTIALPADLSVNEIEEQVIAAEGTKRWVEGMRIRKIIVVPGRIINVVVG
jgi:leucyl-tRNA synthetase